MTLYWSLILDDRPSLPASISGMTERAEGSLAFTHAKERRRRRNRSDEATPNSREVGREDGARDVKEKAP